MKTVNEAVDLGETIDPKHEIEIVCGNCGYDLDESELENLKQSTKIYATSVPPAAGDAAL
jgi:hypothetical protein